MLLFKDGSVQATKVGALSKANLNAFLDSNILTGLTFSLLLTHKYKNIFLPNLLKLNVCSILSLF